MKKYVNYSSTTSCFALYCSEKIEHFPLKNNQNHKSKRCITFQTKRTEIMGLKNSWSRQLSLLFEVLIEKKLYCTIDLFKVHSSLVFSILTSVKRCATMTTVGLRNFSSPQKETLYPLASTALISSAVSSPK